jgi:two-component system sensor histidine kinase UhpB
MKLEKQIYSEMPPLPSQEKLQRFIANLSGMAFQTVLLASGTITFRHISQGSLTLLGVAPDILQTDSTYFLNLIHPDDISCFWITLWQSAQTKCFWNWEGRLNLPGNVTKWVRLGAEPQNGQCGLSLWEGILIDITQSKPGKLENKYTQQHLHELASHIEDAKVEERLRIAREIHDEIGSLLTAIKMDLSWLNQRLPKDNLLLVDKAATITALVNRSIESARNLTENLRAYFLDSFDFITVIEIEAQEFSKRSGVSCAIIKSQEVIHLPETHAISLFRIFQEALNNIMKHAQAKNTRIEIVKGPDHLELIISDNGVGISDNTCNKLRSFGLRGIHERAAHLGGTVKISSNLERGTQIAIFIPLDAGYTSTNSIQQQLFDATTA